MRYTDLDGQTATGTVWAPGPVANSVWVLEDGHCPREPGSAVVVKLPKGDANAAHELDYKLPVRVTDGIACVWVHGPKQRTRWGWEPAPSTTALDYRYAPKLSEKVWRAAVDQDAAQLEFAA